MTKCYIGAMNTTIRIDKGWITSAKLSEMTLDDRGDFGRWLVPGPNITAMLPDLTETRRKFAQSALDREWQLWDAADAGDVMAKGWAGFRAKRPTSRIAEVSPQLVSVPANDRCPVTNRKVPANHAISTCRVCGDTMVRFDRKHHSPFCSDACAAQAQAQRKQPQDYYTKATPTPKPCAHCGETFTPKRSDAKTCSPACRVALHRATP